MWQRAVSQNISWNFAILGKVMRNRDRFLLGVPLDVD
jgi:hypothetical protein